MSRRTDFLTDYTTILYTMIKYRNEKGEAKDKEMRTGHGARRAIASSLGKNYARKRNGLKREMA